MAFYFPNPDVEFRQSGTKSRFIGTSFVAHEISMTIQKPLVVSLSNHSGDHITNVTSAKILRQAHPKFGTGDERKS